MNISYRRDEKYVFVTDDKGNTRKMLKYQNIEAILQLQNELEAINGVIDSKQEMLTCNSIDKKEYKGLQTMTVGSVLMFTLSTIMTFTQVISPLGLLAMAIFLLTAITSAKKLEKIKSIQDNDTVIQNQIQYLEELKKQKEAELKYLKGPQILVAKAMPVTQEIPIPNLKYTTLDILRQCVQVLQEVDKDASMLDVVVAKQAIEEIAKQKTIHK